MTATDAQLATYDFPSRPTDDAALADWTQAMSAFKSDVLPSQSISVTTGSGASDYSVHYRNWAGFTAGTFGGTGHIYVGVKADQTVPSHSGTCGANNGIGIWVGLGGTTVNNDLVQQGIECGNSDVGSGGAFRPFTEFASNYKPVVFCGMETWTFPAGDVIYQNMTYQQSSNPQVANFYIEDITTGFAKGCTNPKPPSWSFNGDTADYVVEAIGNPPSPLDYGTIPYSNANAELDSNGSWVALGSQTTDKYFEGYDSSTYCLWPSAIGSDHTSFSVSWHSSTCF